MPYLSFTAVLSNKEMSTSISGFLVLLVSSFLLTVHGRHFSVSFTDTPCTPRFARTCGEPRLVSEESTQLEESDTVGYVLWVWMGWQRMDACNCGTVLWGTTEI